MTPGNSKIILNFHGTEYYQRRTLHFHFQLILIAMSDKTHNENAILCEQVGQVSEILPEHHASMENLAVNIVESFVGRKLMSSEVVGAFKKTFNSKEIQSKFGADYFTNLKVAFVAAVILLVSRQSYHEYNIYTSIDQLMLRYPSFKSVPLKEQNLLLKFRNFMIVGVDVLSSISSNKTILLKVCAKLEGHKEYHTGGCSKPDTLRRVLIFEQESGTKPKRKAVKNVESVPVPPPVTETFALTPAPVTYSYVSDEDDEHSFGGSIYIVKSASTHFISYDDGRDEFVHRPVAAEGRKRKRKMNSMRKCDSFAEQIKQYGQFSPETSMSAWGYKRDAARADGSFYAYTPSPALTTADSVTPLTSELQDAEQNAVEPRGRTVSGTDFSVQAVSATVSPYVWTPTSSAAAASAAVDASYPDDFILNMLWRDDAVGGNLLEGVDPAVGFTDLK